VDQDVFSSGEVRRRLVPCGGPVDTHVDGTVAATTSAAGVDFAEESRGQQRVDVPLLALEADQVRDERTVEVWRQFVSSKLGTAKQQPQYLAALEFYQRQLLLRNGYLPPNLTAGETEQFFSNALIPMYEYFMGRSALSDSAAKHGIAIYAGCDTNHFALKICSNRGMHPSLLAGDYRSAPIEHVGLAAWCHASPPCQSMSAAGNHLGSLEARGEGFVHWLDLILEATDSPVIVTIETVWGALELPEFEVVLTKLRTKYVPTVTILNSAHLGGYTNGARVLIVAPSTAAVALMNGGVDMSFDVVPCHAVRECFDLSLSRPASFIRDLSEWTGPYRPQSVAYDGPRVLADHPSGKPEDTLLSGDGIASRVRTVHTGWYKLQRSDGTWAAFRPVAVERARMMGIPKGAPFGAEFGEDVACRLIANGIEHNIANLLLQRCSAYLRAYYSRLQSRAAPFGTAPVDVQQLRHRVPSPSDIRVINSVDCGPMTALVDSGAAVVVSTQSQLFADDTGKVCMEPTTVSFTAFGADSKQFDGRARPDLFLRNSDLRVLSRIPDCPAFFCDPNKSTFKTQTLLSEPVFNSLGVGKNGAPLGDESYFYCGTAERVRHPLRRAGWNMLYVDLCLPADVRPLVLDGWTVFDLRKGADVTSEYRPVSHASGELDSGTADLHVAITPSDATHSEVKTERVPYGPFGEDTLELLKEAIRQRNWGAAASLLSAKQRDILKLYHAMGYPSPGTFAAILKRSENKYNISSKDVKRLLPKSIYRCFAYQKKRAKLTHHPTDRAFVPFTAWSFDIQVFSTPSAFGKFTMAVIFVERVHKIVWADYIHSRAGLAAVADKHVQWVARRWKQAVQFYRSDLDGAFRSAKLNNSDVKQSGFMRFASWHRISVYACPVDHHEQNHDPESVMYRLECYTIANLASAWSLSNAWWPLAHQFGVVEQYNKTPKESLHLLEASGEEACSVDVSPNEHADGKPPELPDFPFWTIVSKHLPTGKRGKLEMRSTIGGYIGYATEDNVFHKGPSVPGAALVYTGMRGFVPVSIDVEDVDFSAHLHRHELASLIRAPAMSGFEDLNAEDDDAVDEADQSEPVFTDVPPQSPYGDCVPLEGPRGMPLVHDADRQKVIVNGSSDDRPLLDGIEWADAALTDRDVRGLSRSIVAENDSDDACSEPGEHSESESEFVTVAKSRPLAKKTAKKVPGTSFRDSLVLHGSSAIEFKEGCKKGGKSGKRFARYSQASTIQGYLDEGGTPGDFAWDLPRGIVRCVDPAVHSSLADLIMGWIDVDVNMVGIHSVIMPVCGDGNNSFTHRGYGTLFTEPVNSLAQLENLAFFTRGLDVASVSEPSCPVPLAECITHRMRYHVDINAIVDDVPIDNAEIVIVDDDELFVSTDMKEIASVPPERRQAVYDAVYNEIRGLIDLGTFAWADLPKGRRPIGTRLVMKTKYTPSGSLDKEKARLVVQGCIAIKGRDYDETRAPTCKMQSVRQFMALMLIYGWEAKTSDVKQAFLHSDIDRDGLFIRLPSGLDFKDVDADKTYRVDLPMGSKLEERALLLRKGMYGLAQAPLLWARAISKHMSDIGFRRSRFDPMVFFKRDGQDVVFLSCYVDDIYYTGSSAFMIQKAYDDIKSKYDMTELADFSGFLGMNISRVDSRTLDIDMESKLMNTLQKFEDDPKLHLRAYDSPGSVHHESSDDNPICTPTESHCVAYYMNLVGDINYHVRTWRPDMHNTLSRLSQHLKDPTPSAGRMLVRALGYLKRTAGWKMRLCARGPIPDLNKPLVVEAFSDSNFGDRSDEKARSHMGWNITINGVLVIAKSNRQTFTANSTHEAECVACHGCMEAMMMLVGMLEELEFKVARPMVLRCDNNSAVGTYAAEVAEWRSPTLATKYHHSRDYIDDGDIVIVHIPGTENNSDIHTKWLCNPDHLRHTAWLGLYDPTAN